MFARGPGHTSKQPCQGFLPLLQCHQEMCLDSSNAAANQEVVQMKQSGHSHLLITSCAYDAHDAHDHKQDLSNQLSEW